MEWYCAKVNIRDAQDYCAAFRYLSQPPFHAAPLPPGQPLGLNFSVSMFGLADCPKGWGGAPLV